MKWRPRGAVVEVVVLLALSVFIAVGLRATVAQAFRIPSASMEPQLRNGDRVLVSRLAYRLHDPRRGDVIVFDCPPAAGCLQGGQRSVAKRAVDTVLEALLVRQPHVEEFIKRVIALPGETVQGRDGHIYVDGRLLVEPYLPPATVISDFGPETIPAGHLWVMGDNRTNSTDSRVFGPIAVDKIVGRAVIRAWPPGRTAFL